MDGYSQRELDHFLKEVGNKLDTIHDQTKIINCRVSNLEKWRDRVIAGLVVVAALSSPQLALLINSFM